jgi:hypothetical protein
MLRRTLIGSLLVAVLALFSATRAKADDVFTWTLPASPTIGSGDFMTGNSFTIMGVPLSENGAPVGDFVFDFYNSNGGGGFDAFLMGSATILNEFGPQVYTGPTGNQEGTPTFVPGTYKPFSGTGTLSNGLTGTLVITSTVGAGDSFKYTLSKSVPEPSALLLLGSGLLSLIGLARKRITA